MKTRPPAAPTACCAWKARNRSCRTATSCTSSLMYKMKIWRTGRTACPFGASPRQIPPSSGKAPALRGWGLSAHNLFPPFPTCILPPRFPDSGEATWTSLPRLDAMPGYVLKTSMLEQQNGSSLQGFSPAALETQPAYRPGCRRGRTSMACRVPLNALVTSHAFCAKHPRAVPRPA